MIIYVVGEKEHYHTNSCVVLIFGQWVLKCSIKRSIKPQAVSNSSFLGGPKKPKVNCRLCQDKRKLSIYSK